MQFLGIALRLLTAGTVLGVLGAWLAGRAMRSLLFHVPPIYVPVLIVTGVAMALVSFLACLVPSQRAARISPMEGLAK
jgi:ABC-type antimicrobial peptide transport system permease subunit